MTEDEVEQYIIKYTVKRTSEKKDSFEGEIEMISRSGESPLVLAKGNVSCRECSHLGKTPHLDIKVKN